jgi:hypothetical protein
MNIIQEFESIKQASEILRFHIGTIGRICRNQEEIKRGFTFRLKEQ